MPGSPKNIVVVRGKTSYTDDVVLYKDGIKQKDIIGWPNARDISVLIAGTRKDTIFGFNNQSTGNGLSLIQVTDSGLKFINEYSNLLSGWNQPKSFNDIMYSSIGEVVSPSLNPPIQIAKCVLGDSYDDVAVNDSMKEIVYARIDFWNNKLLHLEQFNSKKYSLKRKYDITITNLANNTSSGKINCLNYTISNDLAFLVRGYYSKTADNIVIIPNSIFSMLPPVADFNANKTSICAGDTISFNDLSTNSPSSWNWTFSSGNPYTATLQNPKVIYQYAGNYDVMLKVTNAVGNNTVTKSKYITVTSTPSPAIYEYRGELSSNYFTGNQWYLNGNIIDSATSQYYKPTKNGNYSFKVTVDGCSAMSDLLNVVNIGIGELESSNFKFQIQPNPNKGIFTLKTEETKKIDINIINILGESVYRSLIDNTQQAIINLNNAPSGIYFIQLQSDGKIYHQKIIVE